MKNITREKIASVNYPAVFAKLGYKFFDDDLKLNIIGIRNMDSSVQNDKFNDFMVILYKHNGSWKREVFACTTDPGLRNMLKPVSSAGTAILVPGQYLDTWQIGLHQNKYRALCQRLKPVRVYRDRNRDNVLDFDPSTIQSGIFGINLHRAAPNALSENVGAWSAGCQVVRDPRDFTKLMQLAEASAKIHGNQFSYTLLTSDQL